MRTDFIRALIDEARVNERVFLLVGDLGYGLVEPFGEEFPERFINAGVAEQNMIGVATGLALCGRIVFVYSIANFPTLRCLEQIRNDACYHNVDVKIVAGGGGLSYGPLGVTHQSTEDVAVMRAMPNMTVVTPGDPVEAALATKAIVNYPGPCYLRLGKTTEPVIYQQPPDFRIGRAIQIRDGGDITLIASGTMLFNTLEAAASLEQNGVQARVLSMHTIKPIDIASVLAAARDTLAIATVEEHSIVGGLGSAVAEIMVESGNTDVYFKRIGIRDAFCTEFGSQEYLQDLYSLSVRGIVEESLRMLGRAGTRRTVSIKPGAVHTL